MNEVSCRTLVAVFRELEARRLPVDALLKDVAVPLGVLRDPDARIDWETFVRIHKNGDALWGDEGWVQVGLQALRALRHRRPLSLHGLFSSLKDFYRRLFTQEPSAEAPLFTCLLPGYTDLGGNRIRLSWKLEDPRLEPCPQFLLTTKAFLEGLPQVMGFAPAIVDLRVQPLEGIFDVVLPPAGAVARWKRPLDRLFAGRSSARELQDAYKAIHQRYLTLEEDLASQATQLRTANDICNAIHEDLDLERALTLITRTLVRTGGFSGARIQLRTTVEGEALSRTEQFGSCAEAAPRIQKRLSSRDRQLGELELWHQGMALARAERLLEATLPTISLAIDNAVIFNGLENYRANLERMVAARTEELQQIRDNLTETVMHLEDAQNARNKIFANLSHEIRTPLSLIELVVHELKTALAQGPKENLKLLVSIERSTRGLLHLIDGLLLLAANQEGRLSLRIGSGDLSSLVREVAEMYRPAASSAGIALTVLCPEYCRASFDEHALSRILSNLLNNALKFTPTGGVIRVEMEVREPFAVISVVDSGVGIDDKTAVQLFERFTQDRAPLRAGARGSGIGLAIVRDLVEAQGGGVRAERNPNRGSRFTFTVPLNNTDTTAPADRLGSVVPGPIAADEMSHIGKVVSEVPTAVSLAPENASAEATLLIAEDDPDLRATMAKLLSARYRVFSAPDGKAALEIARAQLPDLLISDVSMPEMDGLELTRQFRALAGTRLAPVILLTADATRSTRMAGLESGAIDYLTKPFSPSELLARVSGQLSLRHMALRLLEFEKLAALGSLTAGLAHEIRNPANGVVNAIAPLRDLLPAEVQKGGVEELLNVIEDCSKQLGHLSRELLGVLHNGELDGASESTQAIIDYGLRLSSAAVKDVEVTVDVSYFGEVYCSRPLVAQILTNLLENAAQASGKGGQVKITASEHQDLVWIEVSDSGPGVPPELRERIFEPFFTTKPQGQGTGLGLPTARRIAQQHGGSLTVSEGPRGGALFRLALPKEPAVRGLAAQPGFLDPASAPP